MSVVPKNDLKTEKTRSDGATSKREKTNKSRDNKNSNSYLYDTTHETKYSSIILKHLKHGAENAVKSKELKKLLNCDERKLRSIVARERENGIVILANTDGYFLPDSGRKGRAEIIRFINFMLARVASTFKAIYYAKKALERLEGQEDIEGMR